MCHFTEGAVVASNDCLIGVWAGLRAKYREYNCMPCCERTAAVCVNLPIGCVYCVHTYILLRIDTIMMSHMYMHAVNLTLHHQLSQKKLRHDVVYEMPFSDTSIDI